MLADADSAVVVHLAATVGDIGANRRHPGKFFYENMAMGLHLTEHARRHRVEKFVNDGTVCSDPKHTPVLFREEDLFEGFPRRPTPTASPRGPCRFMPRPTRGSTDSMPSASSP